MLEVLTKRPKRVPDLAARAGLSIADTSAALGMLSLTGVIGVQGLTWNQTTFSDYGVSPGQGTAFDRMTISDQNGEFLFLPPGRVVRARPLDG